MRTKAEKPLGVRVSCCVWCATVYVHDTTHNNKMMTHSLSHSPRLDSSGAFFWAAALLALDCIPRNHCLPSSTPTSQLRLPVILHRGRWLHCLMSCQPSGCVEVGTSNKMQPAAASSRSSHLSSSGPCPAIACQPLSCHLHSALKCFEIS